MPSTLDSRSIVACGQAQADENLTASKNFKIRQPQFKSTFRLFEWIYGANGFVPIDIYGQYLKNAIVSFQACMGSHIFHVIPYY